MSNTVIAIRKSGASGNIPNPVSLVYGELSINYADGIVYYKKADDTIGSLRTAEPGGLNEEIQFNDSGSFGASPNLTFNKTTGLLSASNVVVNGYVQFGDGTKQYTANAGLVTAQAAFDKANSANILAQLAYDAANSFASNGISFPITQNDYNSPHILQATTADSNWSVGFYNDGGSVFYTQLAFWGEGSPDRGVRLYDNASGSGWIFDGEGNIVLPTGGDIVRDGVSVLSTAGGNSFGIITANNGSVLATQANDTVSFYGDGAISVGVDELNKRVIFSVPAGYQFNNADYGYVDQPTTTIFDYGTI